MVDFAQTTDRKKMIKFNTWKKQLLLILIGLIYTGALIDVYAEQKEQEVKTVYPVPPPVHKEQEAHKVYPVAPPFAIRGLFPCQACHRKDIRSESREIDRNNLFFGKYFKAPNLKPRILSRMHLNIKLQHGEFQWCLNCHATDERNYLKLINGDIISFEESYRLCGQCHGLIYRDWKLGIHGRRVGKWNGKKLYLLCVHCHDPHSPKFRKIIPKDPPRRPNYGRWEAVNSTK